MTWLCVHCIFNSILGKLVGQVVQFSFRFCFSNRMVPRLLHCEACCFSLLSPYDISSLASHVRLADLCLQDTILAIM